MAKTPRNVTSASSNLEGDYTLNGVMDVTTNPDATLYDVLVKANMAWKPFVVTPTYTSPISGKTYECESRVVMRDDNDEQVGTVGKNYVAKGNLEAFEQVFPAIINLGGIVGRGIEFDSGRKSVIQFRLPEDDLNIGGQSHQHWINLFNSFDGSIDLSVGSCDVTVICRNTFMRALSLSIAGVKHTSNMDFNMTRLTVAIKNIRADYKVFSEELARLADQKVTTDYVDLFAKVMYPITSYNNDGTPNSAAINKRVTFLESADISLKENGNNPNKLAVLNGITRQVDYVNTARGEKSLGDKFEYILNNGQKIKNQAIEILNWPVKQLEESYMASDEYKKTVVVP